MRQRERATCPELSEATGLSQVTVHREVAELCARGELEVAEEAASRGGRRARIYAYAADYAYRVYVEIRRQGAVLHVALEQTNLLGERLSHSESTYAALERESLDGSLDAALRGRRTAGIALSFVGTRARGELRTHLSQRYHCPVVCLNPAEALADEREGTATLYLARHEAPTCCIRRGGRLESTGTLELLPLPGSWDKLDYTDHTLVEEMVARLLQIITCTLAPERIVAHADFWTTRLTERIRFNTDSKLRGEAPPIRFVASTPAAVRAATRAWATRL